eukprot:15642_1
MEFSRLKSIGKKQRCLVFGYMRNIETKLLNKMNIPQIVTNICLLFYDFKDEWDANCIGSRMKIDPDTNILKIVNKKAVGYYQSGYLKTICSPPFNYHWTFKIIKDDGINKYWNMNIGIWKINVGKTLTENYFTDTDLN